MAENKMLVTDLIGEVSNQALSQVALEPFIHWVLEKAPLAIDHDACAIVLSGEAKPAFYLRLNHPVKENFVADFRHKVIDGYIFETKELLVEEDFQVTTLKALGFAGEAVYEGGLASLYVAPLVVRKKLLGVVAIASTKPDFFLVYKLNMFGVFTNQVALAIDSLLAKEQVVKQARIIERDSINMKNAFAGMSEGLIMTDEKDRILLVNSTARRMLSFESEEAEVQLAEFTTQVIVPLLQELAASQKRIVSREVDREKPYKMTVRLDATSAKDSQGRHIGVVIIIRDITREKEIDRMKTEFISIVSHELRTPLTTIRESVSQVLDGILGATTHEQQEFLSICLEDIDRLTRIINDLLDISKIEAKKVELKKSVVDIVALGRSVNLFFYPRASEKGLELETTAHEESIEAYVDRDKIIQVFNNLVGNAMKFTTQGRIELSVADAGDHLECCVSDTGRGIAPEDLPKVFSKFEQFGRTDGPGEKGTGLGLAIAKGIVEVHGGRMWVESRPDVGTSFKFTLPKYMSPDMIREVFERKIMEAKQDIKEFSVVQARVENFSAVSGQFAAPKTYAILIRVVDAVKKIIKGQELVSADGRIRIIADFDRKTCHEALQRLQTVLSSFVISFENRPVMIQCSFNCHCYPEDTDKVPESL